MIDFTRPGRMISFSKKEPKGHICLFNANVCIKSAGKIWFGDLDLMADAKELARLAKEKGETVYVLRERDARFQNEKSPIFENARATISPDGVMELHETFF
jgi:hypothetical protein